jgi:hypothetical protein
MHAPAVFLAVDDLSRAEIDDGFWTASVRFRSLSNRSS